VRKKLSVGWLITLMVLATVPSSAVVRQDGNQQQASPSGRSPLKVKIFEVKYREPNVLVEALNALGSGDSNSKIQANQQLKTITVRDYPENIAAIEDALKRLDVPAASPVSLETRLYLVAATRSNEPSSVPDFLQPVIKQLQSTLSYRSYRYATTLVNRVNDGGTIESSGVADPLFPLPAGTPPNKAFYSFSANPRVATDAAGKEGIQIRKFRFSISTPVQVGPTTQYRDVGIVTELSLREGETAVVGTANLGSSDEAMIVIVSVKVAK
jgi:Bacterial type II/III secretion system short domain